MRTTEPLLLLGVLAAAAVAYAQTRGGGSGVDAEESAEGGAPSPSPTGFWASLNLGRGRSKAAATSNLPNKNREHVYLLPDSFRTALKAAVDGSIPAEVKVRGPRVKTESSDADVDAVVSDAIGRLNSGGLQFIKTALVAYAKETNAGLDAFYSVDFIAYEATTHQTVRLSLASIVDGVQHRIFVHSLRPWNDGILEPTGEGNTGSPESGPYDALASYAALASPPGRISSKSS